MSHGFGGVATAREAGEVFVPETISVPFLNLSANIVRRLAHPAGHFL